MKQRPGFVREKLRKGYTGSLIAQLAKQELASVVATKVPEGPPDLSKTWTPNEGPQAEFFNSDCREILYGGAAGGGKSAALIALPLKWSHLPGFESVILRRESVQLDDLTQKSELLYPNVYEGLSSVASPNYEWTFPAGGKAKFRHCQKPGDYKKYDGWEINLLCFDELTHFTERQYKYLCARVRSSRPELPTLIRATTNPGGPGHEWVFKHWGAWLDPEFMAEGLEPRFDGEKPIPPAKPGEVWWVRTLDDGREVYYREKPTGSPAALSRTFIPALLKDNPYLVDTDYEAGLNVLDPVRREQLKRGDWLIKPAAGLYFQRSWVTFADVGPPEHHVLGRVRAWDFAGTIKKSHKDDPDWTVGVRMAMTETQLFIEDVVRFQGSPGEVKRRVLETAELDGSNTVVRIPQDPGQAGKGQVYDFTVALNGYLVQSAPVTGDKVLRFGPFSSQAQLPGRVVILRGPWLLPYLAELESFPTPGVKDDQVDATSDANDTLANMPRVKIPEQDQNPGDGSRWDDFDGRGFG